MTQSLTSPSSSEIRQRKQPKSTPTSSNTITTPNSQTDQYPLPPRTQSNNPFEITEPLRPKRGVKAIFEEYELDSEFPPTLAQFVDQLPTPIQRNQAFSNFKCSSIENLWKIEDHRQRVLKQFPRAFAHDLTEGEKRQVQFLFQVEEDIAVSLQTKLLIYLFCVFIIVVIIVWYVFYGINLFSHFHYTLLSIFSPDFQPESHLPSLSDVLTNPARYSFYHHQSPQN